MADKYLLRVTAGPSYDPSTHQIVAVNTPHPTQISSPLGTVSLSVRIQNYRGLPRNSPLSSAYFSHPAHTHDQYSISFRLVPRTAIPGAALVFGNDFDSPVRDRLPPGFGTALRIVKWAVDPGIEGDVYADRPFLYGNALSSVNALRVGGLAQPDGDGQEEEEEREGVVEEGGEMGGDLLRNQLGVPSAPDQRRKWFLARDRTDGWVWEKGRVYWCDFFNPYLDFNQFTLKLPGFSLSILGYLGGEDFLRYVLKNKDTGEVYFVVLFSLIPLQIVQSEEEQERGKEGVGKGNEDRSGKETEDRSGKGNEDGKGEVDFEPKGDDLD